VNTKPKIVPAAGLQHVEELSHLHIAKALVNQHLGGMQIDDPQLLAT
jgi:hypothetical protein